MKKIIGLIVIILSVLMIYYSNNNEKIKNINLTKNICLETHENKIIYECMYKKELFTIEEYNYFLKNNENIKYNNNKKDTDFLIENLLTDKLCNDNCKVKLNQNIYEQIIQCSVNNSICSQFLISNNNKKQICEFNSYNEEMFFNKKMFIKYQQLSKKEKEIICNYSKKNIHNGGGSLDINGGMIRDLINEDPLINN